MINNHCQSNNEKNFNNTYGDIYYKWFIWTKQR